MFLQVKSEEELRREEAAAKGGAAKKEIFGDTVNKATISEQILQVQNEKW